MRRLLRSSGLAIGLPFVLALASSCVDNGTTRPTFQGKPIPVNAPRGNFVLPSLVRISEIHYDNSGTDTGERIEITAPVGTNLSQWTLLLYNGSNGQSYNTRELSGIVAASPNCPSGRGVVTFAYPVNGIENGAPDGMALVGPAGLVEFLTYEGVFNAINGSAAGKTGTDIGVSEPGTGAATLSLQRSEADPTFWKGPIASTFDSCNQVAPPPPVASVEVSPASEAVYVGATQPFTAKAFDATHTEISGIALTWTSNNTSRATVNGAGVATGVSVGTATITAAAANGVAGTATLTVEPLPALTDIRFSELHYDNLGTDTEESIEIEGPAGTDLSEWKVVLYNGNGGGAYDTREVAALIPDMCSGRGVIRLAYEQDALQNGSPDGFALIDASGQLVEFLSYEGTVRAVDGPAAGRRSIDIGVSQTNAALGLTLQRNTLGAWVGPIPSSLGGCFGSAAVPPSKSISFSGRTGSDVPLPVGFEDQLFGTLRSPTGVTIPSTFAWEAVTPAIATIDQDGVMHAVTAGRATFRAIAEDGTAGTFSLNTAIATPGTAAVYGNNGEFGEPTDSDASDDFLIRRREFTTSFNRNRGIPNWVAYNLEATHMVSGQDRCDCFTYDPLLPPDFQRYTTADYTGAGAFHGYGIDRGHLARSFDRTAGSLDNANTFLFSNIIPQAADNNQGPWASLESYLGGLAQNHNKEIYVVAGAEGSKGTVKNEGLITIPSSTWKVAVIMPRDQGLANVDSWDDVEVIAVIMPNVGGIRNVAWETYKTTIDAVEALSGYDVLALLPDQVEIAVESNTKPPIATVNGPFTINEGGSVSFNGLATDADGDALTLAWDFGDGQNGAGTTPSHTYAQNGSYAVSFTVTDPRGLVAVATTTVTVNNVAPTITSFTGASIIASGAPLTVSGTFSDAGINDAPWTYSFAWGEGSPTSGSLSSQAIIASASHTYLLAGTYTVRFTVTDRDGGSSYSDLAVRVDRIAVGGDVNPNRINLNDNGNGQVIFRVLSSATFDAASIDVASAKIGGVGPDTNGNGDFKAHLSDVNGDGRPDLVLHFVRGALIDAGALTASSTQLTLLANLVDGRQIQSQAPVSVK